MSDRSTCPTNSSTVARESDKDLAGQGAASPIVAGAAAPASVAGASAESAGPVASLVANLEKAGVESTQKSVVVPLLYDPPSPASSASVGSSKPPVAKAPPAPVDNKVPQLPVSASVPNKQQAVAASAGSPVKPVVPAGQQQAALGQQQVSMQQQQPQQSAVPALGQQQVSSSKPSSQQPQQQSLLAKIQQKP